MERTMESYKINKNKLKGHYAKSCCKILDGRKPQPVVYSKCDCLHKELLVDNILKDWCQSSDRLLPDNVSWGQMFGHKLWKTEISKIDQCQTCLHKC